MAREVQPEKQMRLSGPMGRRDQVEASEDEHTDVSGGCGVGLRFTDRLYRLLFLVSSRLEYFSTVQEYP